MLAIACPGQGAQTSGFLTPWLEVPGFKDRLAWLSAAADIDLLTHGTESDDETIKDTAVAQPLLVAAAIASFAALFGEDTPRPDALAGHSVGEIAAASAAGALSGEQAMILVRERGRAMAEAAAATPTGMSAVLGGSADEVDETILRHGLTPANANGGGQTVAAGTLEQLAALSADPPAKARVIPLKVAGAFHTHHMGPAVSVLERIAPGMTVNDPAVALLSNADGAVVNSGRDYVKRLVRQVSNPVRWDLCMETLKELGVTGLIELPPAGTLTGLAKRGLKGVETLALKTPDDLEAARDMIARHAGVDPEGAKQ
ncbi:ACP S-malonyltransferase [Saxibacter everestensis]|uniref:[acyl-carrier-protein] S-malonyltransferase n=1 Tax=Saxibacter everestensis TaxID=2909229 RepID=A0ABY8QYY7_9MICO|nr:ACP S-malonyltransferase [Brevibacteriaceae bacterium ZFBP1038]